MGKKFDVAALGELLIDFTEVGSSTGERKMFEQNPGGAPANFLTAISHMGYRTAFIGKVGVDMHGDYLKKTLFEEGICTDWIKQDENVFTTLAFVTIDKNGERNFSFARKPGADTCLEVSDLDEVLLENCKIFHIGSLSLTDNPARTSTFEAVKIAKRAGAVISYDPNYRSSLWKNETSAVNMMKQMIPYADMMKVSDEESLLITGEKDYAKAAGYLLKMGPKIVAVTLGEKGVLLAAGNMCEVISGFQVSTVDTTGAGDSFWGGFISRFLEYNKSIGDMSSQEWKNYARAGNAVAALCVGKRGGIPAIPQRKEVESFLHLMQ